MLVNIHEFGNDGDARLAPRSPEIEQRIAISESKRLAPDVLSGNGWSTESFVWNGRQGRFGEWCDADTALLAAKIHVE